MHIAVLAQPVEFTQFDFEANAMRANARLEATAYHEGGHATASWRLGIPLRREGVTIVPDAVAGTTGSSAHPRTIDHSIEYDTSDRNRIRVAG